MPLDPWISVGRGGMPSFMENVTAPGTGVAGPSGAPTIDSVNSIIQGINQGGNMWSPVPTGAGGSITIPPMPSLPSDQGAGNQILQNVLAWGKGQVSPGTTNTIQNTIAQLYGGRGFGPDSAATNAAYIRAMGLTSEGLQKQASDDYSKYMATQLGQEQLQHGYWADQLRAAIAQAQLEEEYYAANQRYMMPRTSGMQLPQNRTPTATFPGGGGTTPAPAPRAITPFPNPTPTPAPTIPAPTDQGWYDWTSEYGTTGAQPAPTDYPWLDWPDTGEYYAGDTYYDQSGSWDPFTDLGYYEMYEG